MSEETIFTKIINREIPAHIVYEDDDHLAFLDISPFEKGHTLVIPKKHYTTIMEMPEDAFLSLMSVVYRLAKHFEDQLDCGINIWQNNKEIAHQEVGHVHFHLIPRREKKKTYCLENRDSYEEGEDKQYADMLRLT